MSKIIIIVLALALFAGCKSKTDNQQVTDSSAPKKVEVKSKDGKYRLYVNNEEFYINGAGCEYGNIEKLAEHGANSFRTWRTENGRQSCKEVLDLAQKNGLMVMMGLEIKRERHGFDYNNADSVKAQLEYVRAEVVKYKDHPALLGWGIGNELNLGAANPKVWDAVNEISKMIHQIDPNHPTTTMLAGIGKTEIDYIKTNCTDIDFICIQMYGDIVNLQQRIADAGWNGPYVVTEWGATGHWEVRTTEWGAPIEETSAEKQNSFLHRYDVAIASDTLHCMGSYAFLWGQKQERTPTWYGMFLESGEETEIVDAMHKIWTGSWPENRCPALDSLRINGKQAFDNVYLKPSEKFEALAAAHDFENDSLTYRWEVLPESTDLGWGGDFESRPETLLHKVGDPKMSLEAPKTPGNYRLFIYVTDGQGHAATANIPFCVKK
jgi:hypothetical protein